MSPLKFSSASRSIEGHASLDQRQRFQQLFFPDGIAFGGNRFVRTGVTLPTFSYLRPIVAGNEGLVDQNSASWNPLLGWLHQIDGLRRDAEAVEAQAEASWARR